MLKHKSCNKKGAAMEWAIIFGFVMFALILLITTVLFSISVKARISKKQYLNARSFDQISEYFIQAVEQGINFDDVKNSAPDTKDFFDSCESRGYTFKEQCAKIDGDKYYRVLTVKDSDNKTLMTLVVKETKGDGKSTQFEVVGRFMGEVTNLSTKLQNLGIPQTALSNQLSTFLTDRNQWHDRCVGNIIECTVSFNLNGASGQIQAITTTNRTCTLPKPSTEPSGKIFAGWTDGTNTYLAGATYTPAGDGEEVTLTAVWKTKRKVTVKVYNSNGKISVNDGTATTTSQTLYVPDGCNVSIYENGFSVPNYTVKTVPNAGYDFDCLKVSSSKINDGYTISGGDKTITVYWKTATYDITFIDCDNSPLTYTYSTSSQSKTLTAPTKFGYKFNGWDISAGSDAVSSYTDTKLSLKAKAAYDIVLKAKWIEQFTVTYNSNGGSASNPVAVDKGASVTLPTPTRTGYTFNGWSDGSTTYKAGASYTVNGNVTLTAQWTAVEYTITLNQDGGSGASLSQTKYTISSKAQTVTINGTSTKTDYTFDGWSISTNSSDKSSISGTTLTIPANATGDITIKANWESNGCLAAGTLVTMADGTQKKIEDVKFGDIVKSYSFYEGKIVNNPIVSVESVFNSDYAAIDIVFKSGKTLNLAQHHSLFDMNTRKYFNISESNYKNQVGKCVMVIDNGKISSDVIKSVSLHKGHGDYYTLITAYDYNVITNGILTVNPKVTDITIFNVNKDYVFDKKMMEKDIETYGVTDYSEWSAYMSKDAYDMTNLRYLDILCAKGNVTREYVLSWLLHSFNSTIEDIFT